MKRPLWLLTAIAAGAFLLAACGSTLDAAQADPNALVTTLVAPDDTIVSADDALLAAAYWQLNGPDSPYDVCFVKTDVPSEDDFVLNYVPAGYVWKLGVVSQLGEPDNTHFVFENPVLGDVFETDGYDQVIVCKNTEVEGGCSYTLGYWKTHSENGPAPYDETWALLASGAATPFFLSGQSYYEAMWTAPKGNPYYILAPQYIAAVLNGLGGADVSVITDELADAEALFALYTPAQIASADKAVQQEFKDLAATLDAYNNGLIGPGHCD